MVTVPSMPLGLNTRLRLGSKAIASLPLPMGSLATIRPESASLGTGGVAAVVALVEQLGAETHVICSLPDDTKVVVRQGHGAVRPDIGEAVSIELDPTAIHLFSADDGARLETSP